MLHCNYRGGPFLLPIVRRQSRLFDDDLTVQDSVFPDKLRMYYGDLRRKRDLPPPDAAES
jgi:hypothetical protein